MERSCGVCEGRCGQIWKRAVLDSQDENQAHWIGGCGLPPAEQMDLLKKRYHGSSQNMIPELPFLIVREGKAFWVERTEPDQCSATLQAFREGCFTGACCYDGTGSMWPIADAKLKQRPSILQRVLPWRRIPVDLTFGPRTQVDVRDVVSLIAVVLQSGGEFCEYLKAPPAEVLRHFELASSPAEVIQIASDNTA